MSKNVLFAPYRKHDPYSGDFTADEELKKEEGKMEEKGMVVREELDFDLVAIDASLRKIREFQKLVRKLTVEGSDYGVIPGTTKPTLLKPGAEKVAKLMNLSDAYEVMEKKEDYEKPLFAYTIRCSLKNIRTGNLISEGIGQCNSWESKYRFRWVFGSGVPDTLDKESLKTKKVHSTKTNQDYTMYRIDNDDIFSQVNTILKMAKKRALVDVVLSAGRLSEIFTQDLEEMGAVKVKEEKKSDPSAASQTGDAPTPKQISAIERMVAKGKINLRDRLVQDFKKETPNELTRQEASTLITKLSAEVFGS